MRHTIFLFLLLPAFLWGQYPNNPRKLLLGTQTTGMGLVYISDGAPSHTPADEEDSWMALDTANNKLYYYDITGAAWDTISVLNDGNGIYSGSDTLQLGTTNVHIRDNSILRFRNDAGGYETMDIQFRDLSTNQIWITAADNSYNQYAFLAIEGGGVSPFIEFDVNGTSSSSVFSVFDDRTVIGTDSLIIGDYNLTTAYQMPTNTGPSTTLNDTTVMAWRGTGSGATPVGFVPYGGGGGGSGTVDHDTSAYFHRRLTFGADYTLPSAVLDTADLISIYAGAQTGTSITITLPTLSDTAYDGKIIYVMGSGAESGEVMRITSPDSTDILVQGCGAGSVTGPDTIRTSYRVLYQYIVSNGRYYRTCQRPNVNSITSVPDTTSIDAHQGDMFVNSTADTLGLYSGSGWVLFYGGGGGSIFKQENTSTAATAGTTDNYHSGRIGIGDFSGATIPAQITVYDTTNARIRLSDVASTDTAATAYIEYYRGIGDAALGAIGYTSNTDADLYITNNLTGGGVTLQTNSTDFFRVAANGQLQAQGYGTNTYTGTAVKYLGVESDGDIIEVDVGASAPSVSTPTVSTGTSIDFQGLDRGVFDLDFSSFSGVAIFTLSNPVNGGEYIFWFDNMAAGDTISMPDNFLTVARDTIGDRVADTDQYVNFFYDGTNYICRDTFWASTTAISDFIQVDTITGLVLWLVADSLDYSNGANVDTVHDFSGNGYHFVMDTVANQGSYVTGARNGHSAITFNGTSDYYIGPDLGTFPNGVEVFVVHDPDTDDAGLIGNIDGVGNVADFLFIIRAAGGGSTTAGLVDLASGSNIEAVDGSVYTQAWQLSNFYYDNSTLAIYDNGSLDNSESHSDTMDGSTTPAYLGAYNTSPPDHFYQNNIAEVIVLNQPGSAIRTAVMNYLIEKYGL